MIKVIMNDILSTATGYYATNDPGIPGPHESNGTVGSVQVTTNSSFDGTTSTVALEASNDGVDWFTVYQDDNTTAMQYTLSAGNNNYIWILKIVGFRFYRINYSKGNATTGRLKGIFYINQ